MIIWGSRTKGEPRGFVIGPCARCQREQIHLIGELKRKFTLFFVPTFTMSRTALLICTKCEWKSELRGQQAGSVLVSAMSEAQVLAEMRRRELASHSSTEQPGPGQTQSGSGAQDVLRDGGS